jgi:hypothetical protein
MADRPRRAALIREINQAFNAANIAATINRLGALSTRDDCLSIVDRLGFLTPIHAGNLRQYRRVVGIPDLNLRILTLAFRTSVLNQPAPIPLEIDIVDGQSEAVSVSVTPANISVLLTRLPQQAAGTP